MDAVGVGGEELLGGGGWGREGWGSREASRGGAPALAGRDTACGCRVSSVVSKIFAAEKKKEK